jgi:phosphoesterase RecJ-like protein
MTHQQVLDIQKLLATSQKIVVVGHKNPDGDAVGSCLGLANFLNQLGHQATVVMPNDFPDFLKWIPEAEKIVVFEQKSKETQQLLTEATLIFTLDFNALNRTGDLEKLLREASANFVMIDHHQQPENFAVVTYSDVNMCATSQMVYHFIESLNALEKLNKNIATQLYTGIMTDTGSFRYPSTTPTTHRVIASLLENGANGSEIHQNVYDTNTPDRIKLLGTALNNLVILEEFKTAYITLTQEELDKHNYKKGDTEGFVNYALSVKGIIFAAIFIESKQDGIIKISFRSKGSFSVNQFARNHFNGGGHINAAGGRSELSLKETISNFISILPHYKNALLEDA